MKRQRHYIIAADRIIDGRGDFSITEKILTEARRSDLEVETLEIVPLSCPWKENLGPRRFKSGAGTMAALKKARRLIQQRKASLVVITGSDLLKSGYTREERGQLMKLYERGMTPLDGYEKLVPLFLRHQKTTGKRFREISELLFANYLRTWKKLHPEAGLPEGKWFLPLTKHFRGVDCANPHIDYAGQVIVADERHADLLRIPRKERVEILGNAFTQLSVDGMASLPKVAQYLHLKKVIKAALSESKVDFRHEFLGGKALLDAYTCYPVAPMALLLQLGLVDGLDEIPGLLERHEITVTGGLNLARAPWNLTSLDSLIVMRERLISSKTFRHGLVHGNGSLGSLQGITVLGLPAQ